MKPTILIALGLFAPKAHAVDHEACFVGIQCYSTIQSAIDAAQPGDRVLVCGSFAAVAEGRRALGRGS